MSGEVELANDRVRVTVLPELGGKIARLTSRASGREWLWRNPHLPYRRAEPSDSYVALHDTGGIDECFPEVHGEVFGRPWSVERDGRGSPFCDGRVSAAAEACGSRARRSSSTTRSRIAPSASSRSCGACTRCWRSSPG